MLQVVNADGAPLFSLKLGVAADGRQVSYGMSKPIYCEADGMELDECRRILVRNVPGPKYRFGYLATQEIVLNWR